MEAFILQFHENKLIILFLYAVIIDVFFGILRSIKQKKINSNIGISGCIRKAAMIATVVFLFFVDRIININFLFIIPEEWLKFVGTEKVGLSELFAIFYMLFEILSILKNMSLLGIPVPKVSKYLEDKLKYFTNEFKNKNG